MSTALPKEDNYSIDPHETLTGKIVQLETATETMMAYIGYLSTQIMNEEAQPVPNQNRIKALEEQMQQISKERREITPENGRLIAKALYVYAPVMKALYAAE